MNRFNVTVCLFNGHQAVSQFKSIKSQSNILRRVVSSYNKVYEANETNVCNDQIEIAVLAAVIWALSKKFQRG